MRKLLFTVHCSLLTIFSFAQTNKVTLTGSIRVNTNETFPYRIVATESNGEIKGYSLTYIEPDETKALITGILDRKAHTLSFKETEIVYSHGVHTKAFMCLIDATMEYVQGAKGSILKGPITSMEADKTACTGGTITFGNDEQLQNLFSYHEQFDTVISMKKKVRTTNEIKSEQPVAVQAPLVTDKVTAGIEKAYDWHTDTVVLDIWDGGNLDGDRVTLQFNGVPVLTNYYLVKERRRLKLLLHGNDVNTITIVADNEGSDPPNTTSIMLTDGTTQYSVLAYNNKNERAVIKIRKAGKQ